jgi:hypothetical protein
LFVSLFIKRSTEGDDDEEWGWDESPNKAGKVEITGMKLTSNSNLMHRSISSDNGNESHAPEMLNRSFSGQSQNSYRDGMSHSASSNSSGVVNKTFAAPVRQPPPEPDDFFEQMGLAAKPKLTASIKPQAKSIQSKQMPLRVAAKPKVPPAAPAPKKSNKLGATTIRSDSGDDMGDDDWGDNDADLDDLLKD